MNRKMESRLTEILETNTKELYFKETFPSNGKARTEQHPNVPIMVASVG